MNLRKSAATHKSDEVTSERGTSLQRRIQSTAYFLPLTAYCSLLTAFMSHRSIRSYVLRQGRITDAQRRASETLLPRFGVPYSREPLDLDQVFGLSLIHI